MEWNLLRKYMAARPGAPVERVSVEVGDWVQYGRLIGIVEGFSPPWDSTDCLVEVCVYPSERRTSWHIQNVTKIEPRDWETATAGE